MSNAVIEAPVLIDGRVYTKNSDVIITDEARIQGEKDYARAVIREGIKRGAGDQETREGVMSDVTAVLLTRFCSLVEKMAQAKTVEQVREAAGEHLEFARSIKAIELPYTVKGMNDSSVLADLGKVSRAVNGALKNPKA